MLLFILPPASAELKWWVLTHCSLTLSGSHTAILETTVPSHRTMASGPAFGALDFRSRRRSCGAVTILVAFHVDGRSPRSSAGHVVPISLTHTHFERLHTMNALSFVKSLFSVRNSSDNNNNPSALATTAPVPAAKVIPFGVGTKKQPTRSYDYQDQGRVFGDISLEMVSQLHSDRIKHAILSYAAWSSLAIAFGLYQKTKGRYVREEVIQKFQHSVDTFHAWNASLPTPMGEEQVEDITTRLTSPLIPQENNETDIIRARVRGCTVEEIKSQRLAKAEKERALRESHVAGFLSEVWSGTSIADDPVMPAIKVLAKAEATLEWMAQQDWIDTADLLIAEADIKILKGLTKEYGGYEGSRAIDEALASEEMMAAGLASGK